MSFARILYVAGATACSLLVAPDAGTAWPGAGVLAPAGAMRVARASHTATVLADGRVLIAGGFGGSGTEAHPFASTELYDPRRGTFVDGPSMRVGRSGHTATTLGDGRILVAGGWTGGGDALGTAELYDPRTGAFTPTGRMRVPRAGSTATLLRDGRVLVVGGVDAGETPLDVAELYDPRTGAFTPTASLHAPRAAHTATRLADGRVLVIGGSAGHYPAATMQGEAELYDPATSAFVPAGRLLTPRHKHAAALLADGSVLVVGGSDARDWQGQLASVERWDPHRLAFAPAGSIATRRFKLPDAVAALPNGLVLVAGGAEQAEVYRPDAERTAPVAGTLGAARWFAAATLLRDGRVLVTGGYVDRDRRLTSVSRADLYVAR